MRQLELEEEMRSPEGQGYVRHAPAFLPIKAERSLFEMALASMRASFEERNHFPSTAQWEALEAVVRNVEQMADGTLKQVAYLSSLDPGVGKTQSIIHSVCALLKLERYRDVGVIIFLGRLAEIQPIVGEMRLADEQFAVFVADTKENSHLNSMGNRDKNRARVLFTTQEMLERRSKSKKFAEIEEFHFRRAARQIRVWDEAIPPTSPICVNVTLIEAMTHILRKHNRKLFDEINALIAMVKRANDREFVEVPAFEELYGVDTDDVLKLRIRTKFGRGQ